MVLFNDKKNAFSDNREKEPPQVSFAARCLLIFAFGVCLSCLLSVAGTAGRFIEYRAPLFLMEFPKTLFSIACCLLFFALLSGLVLQKTVNADSDDNVKIVLSRSQKISYFFSLMATLGVTAYFCAVAVNALKTGNFLVESLYILFLYAGVLSVHFKAGKSSLAHMFTTAAFILTMIVTAFYGGIAAAKITDKHIAQIDGETFTLVASRRDDYILTGFDIRNAKSNGKLLILPKQSAVSERTVFQPVTEKRL